MRVEEARRSAEVFLSGTGKSEISIYGFRDGFLPFQGELVKEAFEDLKANFGPDLILDCERIDGFASRSSADTECSRCSG